MNSEFLCKGASDPPQEYFDVILEQYEKVYGETADEDDAWCEEDEVPMVRVSSTEMQITALGLKHNYTKLGNHFV